VVTAKANITTAADKMHRRVARLAGEDTPDQNIWFSFLGFLVDQNAIAPQKVARASAVEFSSRANFHFVAVYSLMRMESFQLAIFIDYLIGFSLMFCSSGVLNRGQNRFLRDARCTRFETGKPPQFKIHVARYQFVRARWRLPAQRRSQLRPL
jgi:hypothetical protein